MTEQEVAEVMATPVEEVVEYTKTVELADYVQENPEMTIEQLVDKVNEDIEASKKSEVVDEPITESMESTDTFTDVPKKKKKKSWMYDVNE